MTKFKLFIIGLCISGSACGRDCVSTVSQQDAEKEVAKYREIQSQAPKKFDKYTVVFERNISSCHYIYTEIMKPEVNHGRIDFVLNDHAQVVDVRTAFPLPMGALRCPEKSFDVDYFSKRITEYRNTNEIKIFPSEKNRKKKKLSRLQCNYVYEEFPEDANVEGNTNFFYFDFNGELIDFFPKKSS